jgi:ADP-ribose pyrophosphatase YjhB (NUDIX family)
MPWLRWSRELHSIAQAGFTYSRDPYDRERFTQIQRIAAEMIAHHTGSSPSTVLPLLRAESGYATPKLDVRVAVFRDDRILLVRESSDGRWSLPGGWCDVGESASAVAAREVLEESGYEVRITKLLALLDKARHPDHPPELWHAYKVFFRGEVTGGAPRTSLETTEVDWFARDAIPPLSLPRNTPGQVARLFEHHDDPGLPADFD